MRVLGIDYSSRTIGLALGDSFSKIAVPLDILRGGHETLPVLLKLIDTEKIAAIVLGNPIPFRGVHAKHAQNRVLEFYALLRDSVTIPIYMQDEAFTTKEARRLRDEEGSGVPEDALAAMLIVEDFFHSPEGEALCGTQ